MRIISPRALKIYWDEHPVAQEVLNDWYKKIKRIKAGTIVELRRTFPSADSVGNCVVFNVGGNNYRIITRINFRRGIVYIRFVLSHSDYDKGRWKADC